MRIFKILAFHLSATTPVPKMTPLNSVSSKESLCGWYIRNNQELGYAAFRVKGKQAEPCRVRLEFFGPVPGARQTGNHLAGLGRASAWHFQICVEPGQEKEQPVWCSTSCARTEICLFAVAQSVSALAMPGYIVTSAAR